MNALAQMCVTEQNNARQVATFHESASLAVAPERVRWRMRMISPIHAKEMPTAIKLAFTHLVGTVQRGT